MFTEHENKNWESECSVQVSRDLGVILIWGKYSKNLNFAFFFLKDNICSFQKNTWFAIGHVDIPNI